MSLGTWIFGTLGFVLGGPIGALVGAVIGSLLGGSTNSKALPSDDDQPKYARSRHTVTEGDIHISLLVLIAAVMKADGHVRKSELDVVKNFIRTTYTEEKGKQLLQILKQLLEKQIDYVSVADQIAFYLNYSLRLEYVRLLLEIAHADGEMVAQEEKVILAVANCFNISSADYRSLSALYQKQTDPNWAYQALEIEPSATNEEVKKAYRRMAMKYHPDKVASAGDDIKQKATEKFRAINEAYEYIKKQRGLV